MSCLIKKSPEQAHSGENFITLLLRESLRGVYLLRKFLMFPDISGLNS